MGKRVIDIQWVRTPHQDRSRKTLERLLDAAETLLRERGFEHVSVAEIAQSAGSSVGAFYARFRDKDGLLHHLHERFCDEAIATADAAMAPAQWQDAGAEEIITAITAFMAEIYRTRRGLFRAFLMHGCTDPQFRERDRRVGERVLGGLTALLLERRGEFDHPHPAFAVAFGLELIAGVLRERYVLGGEERAVRDPSDPGLAEELTRAYARYLGLRPAEAVAAPAGHQAAG